MIDIKEIKEVDEKACNCCRTRDSDKKYYNISFIKIQKTGTATHNCGFTSGFHVKLCEDCVKELFDKTMEIALQGKNRIERS